MKKFQIDQSFWELFPEAQVNVLVLHDVDNHIKNTQHSEAVLKQAETKAAQFLTEDNFSDNPIVQSWRQTYQQFKKKKGARASIEALLKRVDQGKGVGAINPLVDLYNSISLQYGVPVGAEDLSTIKGDIHLGKAKGGEAFYPLGDDENEPALPEEIIYYDDEGAICRCLNWRDGKRTMLTEDSSDVIMFMEATNDIQKERLDDATQALKTLINTEMGVEGTMYQVVQNAPIITFDEK
ncbi:DNA/RNA-binding domain of Phe-tRNA-synthetase-like protein [Weissella uvarum]|uniref:B3/B4 domain-containing protein n=1 Tax=Weissella uvarum TaxID=1479233 RepID=UPI001960B2E2|nr:B3/4 domain-containing protein [Weissella uvarum]MBM7617540.1 DNA/RNA-binding domain of Phe-tRNA-synthetase-like protein [Weissella uvarum]MCM0595578.1 B3/4 domain-containing protein [Weissella uvarum]